MSKVKLHVSVSLDGFTAGPDQSEENPLGIGGGQLHEWAFKLEAFGTEGGEVNASTPLAEDILSGVGAVIMGRNMFGGGTGDWGDGSWKGWWGDDPPYHCPVFVLTHHEREPLEMEGGTTFHFVTGGVGSALEQAKVAAGDEYISIGGGADAARQFLAAGLIDEITLDLIPVLLGDGARLFEGLGGLDLESTGVVEAPDATHLSFRPVR